MNLIALDRHVFVGRFRALRPDVSEADAGAIYDMLTGEPSDNAFREALGDVCRCVRDLAEYAHHVREEGRR